MINFGIIGPGNIAKRAAQGILCSPKANLYAVASRNLEKAKKFQEVYGASVAYGSYEELLADPKVDAVYICTPNTLHYDQIMMCLSHKKHVVCEKPMVENEQQVKEVFAKAREMGCFLMEAEKTMFTPLNVKLKNLVQEGTIGKLQAIRGEFSFNVLNSLDAEHWVLGKEMGGSAFDIGVYPICFAHFFADAEVKDSMVERIEHPDFACDFGMHADVWYENGIYAFLQSNWFYTPKYKGRAVLSGDKGYLEIPEFWKGKKAYLHIGDKVDEISVEMESDFEGEVTHAAQCIEQGLLESPVLGEAMSCKIIRIVEKIKK